MVPAFSVIFFTVASGAGYGLLFWTAVATLGAWWQPGDTGAAAARPALILALLLVTAGLASSTLHLGHPERAWRAFTQWRSSWLSREGVLAIAGFLPALMLTAGWWLAPGNPVLLMSGAAGVLLLAPATVFTTAMIYASLKPIPRWSTPWVPPAYVAFSLASGAVLALALQPLAARPPGTALWGGIAVLALGWLVKLAYWRTTDGCSATVTSGSATGLGRFGDVTLLESPHTSANYVLKEMGFVVARRHARRLRRIAVLFGALLPAVSLLLALGVTAAPQSMLLAFAAASMLVGLVVERWLFFAEAKHVVTVFYGEHGA